MRILLTWVMAILTVLSVRAQTNLLPASMNYGFWQPSPSYYLLGNDNQATSKWHLNTYTGISAGFGFFNGGSATFISAPVGLQLSHPLNNNLIAFTGVSVAPTFYSFSHSFNGSSFNNAYPGSFMSNAYGVGINSRVEMGLMYVNDARTFSISGSIGVDRGSYPVYPQQTQQRTSRNKQ